MSITEQSSEILTLINERFDELTGEECANFAMRLSALLYPIRMYEAKAEGKYNKRMTEIISGQDKVNATAAEIQARSEEVFLHWKKLVALRMSAEETIMTLKARVKVMLAEQHEFNE